MYAARFVRNNKTGSNIIATAHQKITRANLIFSAHDKKIKKSDKTRHNSNFFDELNHAKSYQT